MLELISVEIDGFLSHGKTGLIPLNQPGITSIQGAMGAGKSAIYEAVSYLLRDETVRTVRLVDDLINKVVQDGYDIALNYRVDADLYRVQEVRGRKGKGLFFWKNGDPIQGAKTSDVRKRIAESLGMSSDDFGAIAFMGQNQFQRLVYGKSTERANEIIRIYGLNQYDQALKNCGKDVEKSVAERKLLTIALDSAVLDQKRLEDQFNAGDTTAPSDDAQFLGLQKEIDDVEEALKKLRPKEGKAREDLGKAKALREKHALLLGIQKEIATIQTDLNGMAESKHSSETLQNGLDTIKEKLANVSAAISQAKVRLKSVQDLGEKCPINCEVCPVGIPAQYKNSQVTECTGIIEAKSDEFDTLVAKVDYLKRLLTEVTTRSKLQEKLKDKTYNLSMLGDVGDVPDLSEKEQLVQKYGDLITRGTTKLRSLNGSLTQLKEAQAAYRKSQEYKIKIGELVEEKRKALRKSQEAIDVHDIEHQYLVTALNILKKAKAYKIDYVLNLLNEHVQENLDRISDGVLQTSFSSQREDSTGKKLLESIDIYVSDSYKKIPFELASGGQQAQLSLAVLSAVFETARKVTNKAVSSLWLDEVFGPISSDALDRVFESLIDLSERIGVSSIKVISHRDLDSRFIDHRWDVKLENGITHVELN